MKGLTKRQHEMLQFLEHYIEKHRYSPSYREMQNHFGLSSLGTIYKHIQVLKRKGFVIADQRSSRSIALTKKVISKDFSPGIEVPFIGHIASGSPIEIFSKTQTFSIPNFLVSTPEKTYILRARGDSLNEELISDGDLLIVEARQEAQPGEIVIAMINQQDIIVKRYHPEGQFVRLESRTPHHQPIILKHEHLNIQGIVVGLLRLYS